MIIGMGNPIQTLPISAAAHREVDLVGVFRYANAYPDAIKMISSTSPGYPDFSKLVTHRFNGFDQVQAAFKMAARTTDDQGNPVLKVVIETGEDMIES
jgi:L-iditol 2-dehydrogenase